jgi:hypothetical protein
MHAALLAVREEDPVACDGARNRRCCQNMQIKPGKGRVVVGEVKVLLIALGIFKTLK